MEQIFVLLGIALGYILKIIVDNRKTIVGEIDVDHNTEQCLIKITSNDLANRRCKKVVMTVNHNARIRVNNSDYNE